MSPTEDAAEARFDYWTDRMLGLVAALVIIGTIAVVARAIVQAVTGA